MGVGPVGIDCLMVCPAIGGGLPIKGGLFPSDCGGAPLNGGLVAWKGGLVDIIGCSP